MLERLSDLFYDPVVFWGVPLALALAWGGLRRACAWLGSRGRHALFRKQGFRSPG